MPVAIDLAYREPSATTSGEILGINVAIDDFLKGWFRHTRYDQYICHPADTPSYEHFKKIAAENGIDPQLRCIGLDPRTPDKNLKPLTTIFRPDPAISRLAWQRTQVPGPGFLACGLVHTMSGSESVQAVADLCVAPTEATDALICPSHSIRDVVHRVWDSYAEYLGHRFNINFKCQLQTPVVPLGVDTAKFINLMTPDKRQAQREALNIKDDEIVILFVGRLSFATKAHPLPLMQAVEMAQKKTKKKLRLVFFGYYKPEDMEQQFKALVPDVCPSVTCTFIENTDPRFPRGFLAGADIFASLVENIQESFGLTPVEAMAAGLPIVATGWDGYRETVRHGTDGFLIPTLMPPESAGMDIAKHYFNDRNYGNYLIASSQSTAIDIVKAADAFVKLAEDSELRHEMGANGRIRATEKFEWRVTILVYQALWQHLEEMRRNAPRQQHMPANWQAAHPFHLNPWWAFNSFPSIRLSPDGFIVSTSTHDDMKKIMEHRMNFYLPDLLCTEDEILKIADVIRQVGRIRIGDLINADPTNDPSRLWRCFGWLLKHGLCVYEKP